MNELDRSEVYKRYLEEGVNNLNTTELLIVIDMLYSDENFHEVIDVTEYTISLFDMGISNDLTDEDFTNWLNNGFEKDEVDDEIDFDNIFPDEEIDFIEEYNNSKKNSQEQNEEDIEDDEDRRNDKIETLREDLLKLIIECALRVGNYDKVYPTIDKFLETSDIREADLYNDVALIGMNVDDYMFSIKYLKMIVDDNIHKVAAINNLAICYEALGDVEKGKKLLQDYLDEDPYDIITWINLGNLLARSNELDEALKAFDIAFAIDDTNMACLKNIARVYKVKGNFNKAIKYLDDAEKLDPNDYEVLIIKAECYLIMNKPKKAIKLFNTVLEEFPDRAEIYHSLSVAYIIDGQTEKGYRTAVRAWKLDPDNHFFKSFVAKILGENKGLRAQADKLNREILRDSKDPNIHMIVAQYYLNDKNPNKALKIALDVEKDYPNMHHINIFLSRCYTVLGNLDAAQEAFDKEPDEQAKQEFYNTLNNAKSN
jgi:tetratricopeptide (TPR) repeat protein